MNVKGISRSLSGVKSVKSDANDQSYAQADVHEPVTTSRVPHAFEEIVFF